jgi:hypothetical protein
MIGRGSGIAGAVREEESDAEERPSGEEWT